MNKGSKIIFQDKINMFILLVNILFMGYYIMLAYYSRPHYDDLHFLWKLKQMSIADYIGDMYYSRSGRFIGYLLNGLVYKIILILGEHRFFPVLFGAIGFIFTWMGLRSLMPLNLKYFSFQAVLFAFNLSILTNIDFAVFNWLCAMSYYWLGPMLLLLLHFIKEDRLSLFRWAFFVLLSIILGGIQEAYTPIVMLVVFTMGIYYSRQQSVNFKMSVFNPQIQKAIISLFILLVCFIVVVIAPGNYLRMASDEFVSPQNITQFLKALLNAVGIFSYFQFFYMPYYILLALIFIVIGYSSKNDININIKYAKFILISTIIFFIYLFLSVLPSIYLWGGFGIQRNYTHVVFMLIVFISLHAFMFGYFKLQKQSSQLISIMLIIGLFIVILVMGINFVYDSKSASNYAASVDKRLEYLESQKQMGVTGIIEVPPLEIPYTYDPKYLLFEILRKKPNPRPVLYYTSDTDISPNEYSFHLRKLYGFDFDIKLSQTQR